MAICFVILTRNQFTLQFLREGSIGLIRSGALSLEHEVALSPLVQKNEAQPT